MYTNYPYSYQHSDYVPYNYDNSSDDRLGGGLLAAGLVGGLAGAAVSPFFNRRCCYPYPVFYPPYYPPYGRYFW